MKQVIIHELEEWEQNYLAPKLKNYKTTFSSEILLDVDASIKKAQILGVFVHTPVTESLLKELPSLEFITTMSTGYDHIDLKACKQRGILVSNVPSYGENTVAEHTFGLILGLSKKLKNAIERTEKGSFSIEGLMGFDLKGKTLGVIGSGRIGQHVIKIAKGFDMNVIVCNKNQDKKIARELGFEYSTLDGLLRKSDIVTLHVPLIKETKHMIGRKEIAKMKRGSYIINTSRGELIDTIALLNGLKKGILAGAALDVIEHEQTMVEHRRKGDRTLHEKTKKLLEELHKHNTIITPHCAFDTKEAIMRILDTTVMNINAFVKGKPQNLVTLP